MKKSAFLLAILTSSLFSGSLFGSCEFINFYQSGPYDSATFYFSESEIEKINYDDVGIELAVSVVQHLAREKCGKAFRVFEVNDWESGCREIIRGNEGSEVCYVDTNEGEFFMIRDAMGGAQVIYNRLD